MSSFTRPTKKQVEKELNVRKPDNGDEGLYEYMQERAEGVAKSIYARVVESSLNEGGLVLLTGSGMSGKSSAILKLNEMFSKSDEELKLSKPVMRRADIVDGIIQTYDGRWEYAMGFDDHEGVKKVFEGNGVVVIDDVMFVPYEIQAYLISAIKLYIARGGWVIAMGYLFNANGNEFLLTQLLKTRADIHFEMKGMCLKCGERNAVINQRLVNGVPASMEDDEQVPGGGGVIYEPRCQECHIFFH